jgi:hypothetical protein
MTGVFPTANVRQVPKADPGMQRFILAFLHRPHDLLARPFCHSHARGSRARGIPRLRFFQAGQPSPTFRTRQNNCPRRSGILSRAKDAREWQTPNKSLFSLTGVGSR